MSEPEANVERRSAEDARSLSELGGRIAYVRVDHQFRLQLEDTEIVIESPFTVGPPGAAVRCDPSRRAGLGPALALYPGEVRVASVDVDGTLTLHFASGELLTVPPDPHYEAWQIVGPGSRLIVCAPGGGEVAVWSAGHGEPPDTR